MNSKFFALRVDIGRGNKYVTFAVMHDPHNEEIVQQHNVLRGFKSAGGEWEFSVLVFAKEEQGDLHKVGWHFTPTPLIATPEMREFCEQA